MNTWAGKLLGWLSLAAVFSFGALVPYTACAAADPVITSQPSSQSAMAGVNVGFSVTATGNSLVYQWRFNGTNLAGSAHILSPNSPMMIVMNVSASDIGNYQVIITNSHGSVTSAVATLTVLLPPAITNQPAAQAVLLNSNATFSVQASGTAPLTYQWRKAGVDLNDGGTISGATSATLNLSNIQTNDAGSYQVIVTNNYGSATSAVATLSVLLPPVIPMQPTNRTVSFGATTVFAAAGTGTAPLVYRWQKDGTNLVDGNGFSGTGTSSLVISNAQMSHVGNYRLVMTNAYGIAISPPASLSVVPIMAWGNDPATSVPLTLTNPLIIAAGASHALAINSDGTVQGWGYNGNNIATPPLGLTNVVAVSAGSWDYYSLALKGDGTLVSWGNPSYTNLPAGLTNIVAISIGDNHSLALRSDGTVVGWGDNYANKATPPVGLSNVIAIAAGASHSIALKNDGTIVWGNADSKPAGATNIVAIAAGAGFSMALRNDGTMFAWGNNYFGQINWYSTNIIGISAAGLRGFAIQRDKTIVGWGYDRYGEGTPPAGLSNVVAVVGGTYFSLAQVENPAEQVQPTFWWQPTSRVLPTGDTLVLNPYLQGSLPMSFQWYFNGTALAGETNKWLVLSPIQAGQAGDYQLVVSNRAGSAASAVVTVTQTPGIAVPPADQSVLRGSNVTFSAAVAGNGPFDYRWFYNGQPLSEGGRISGTTTTNLSITNLQTNDAGSYHLVVTNLYGATASPAAALTVLVAAAIITQPTNQFAYTGASVTLSITAEGTAPLNYLWYSNGVPLANGGRFSGVTSPALNITGLVTNDSAAYHVIVTNSFSAATSSVANLTVLDPARITLHPVSQAPLLGSNVTFTVAASGSEPLTYRWYFNGSLLSDGGRISGSGTPALAIANVENTDVGGYVAVVTNPVSAAASRIASLTPLASPMASIRYVSVSNTTPQPPYLSWSAAATNIQDAVDAAIADDFIIVSNGTYKTGGRAASGSSTTNRLTVDKTVTIQSVNGAAVTVIAGSFVHGGEATRCVYLTNGAVLMGFTLTNGGLYSIGDFARDQSGGGVWCESSTAIVSNCVLSGNYAPRYGGGAYQGTLFNCLITNNSAGQGGGACSNALFNCTLIKNVASFQNLNSGGGAYVCTLSNCLVVGNKCGGGGGGAYFSTLTSCVVSNNSSIIGGGLYLGVANDSLISSNRASNYGGGAYSNVLNNCVLQNNYALHGGGTYSSQLSGCSLTNNRASGGMGGGAYQGTLTNCVLFGNWAYNSGGGTYSATLYQCQVISNSTSYNSQGGVVNSTCFNCILRNNTVGADNSQLYNCTVVSNTGGYGVYGGTSYNSIIYYNTNNNWSLGAAKFNNCITFPTSVGVVSTNAPLFVNLAGGDFHLQSNSPCINAGNNSYVTNLTDLDGLPRIVGGTVDIGAYEFQSPASTLSYAWAQQYGLPTDGSADTTDADGDNVNNFGEFKSGTNPTNALSVLKLNSPAPGISGFIVTWQSVSGVLYYVQRSTNLADGFSTIVSNRVGSAGSTSYADTTATNKVPHFYRVGVQ